MHLVFQESFPLNFTLNKTIIRYPYKDIDTYYLRMDETLLTARWQEARIYGNWLKDSYHISYLRTNKTWPWCSIWQRGHGDSLHFKQKYIQSASAWLWILIKDGLHLHVIDHLILSNKLTVKKFDCTVKQKYLFEIHAGKQLQSQCIKPLHAAN